QKLFAFGRAFCFIILVSEGKMYYNIKVWNGMGNAPWQECSAKCRSGAMGNRKYDKGVCFQWQIILQ
ncbi:MAG: hypothetical protein ACLTYY_05265, partial [Faecalibacterium prausnitzii]